MAKSTLVWLRNDLRISDNPALADALGRSEPVHALYVIETDRGLRPLGGAARVWLSMSLDRLNCDLAERGVRLHVREGESGAIVPRTARSLQAGRVVWNRRYDPAGRAHDAGLKAALHAEGLEVESFNAALLFEPWSIATKTGTPYSVYTPFANALRQKDVPAPIGRIAKHDPVNAGRLDLPVAPGWADGIVSAWTPGEAAAKRTLAGFLDEKLADYPKGRDVLAKDATSRLSPHLRFGEIGPRQVWWATRHAMDAHPGLARAGETFLSELIWREFAYHQLYHRDDIARHPMQARFEKTEWRTDVKAMHAWQKGMTGIPVVDAGMRQLWQTGTMHNRVRMIAASLLAKNLLIDWKKGEDWFWDTLVDADPANNPFNWQWVAGCGTDAAPYFRVFNPVTQGQKFDPEGTYVKRFVPELEKLEARWVHRPWEASRTVLEAAGITLGLTYPAPVVDLKDSRERALSILGRA